MAGVNAVSVTLYLWTIEFWQPVSTTLTASDPLGNPGYYTFTDLRAGAYVVVLPASNFTVGGPLESYRSSTPTTLDPNNDANRDDNGIEIGAIVASRAVALSLYGEPVNDDAPVSDPYADGDSNSNYSIDFNAVELLTGHRLRAYEGTQNFWVVPALSYRSSPAERARQASSINAWVETTRERSR